MEISRMIFAACPPIYHLPGTWDDPEKIAKCMETLIPHAHLQGGAAFAVFIAFAVFVLMGYGVYMTFGAGGKDLKDEIKEHARMHELGIAHGHEGGGARPVMSQKAQEQDYPQHHHDK